MKKFLSFVSALLLLSAAAFAEVTVKKLSDGKVEVTFFYGNPRAQEVVIAGDFTNWQNGALPMTKGDKGWTFVTTVPAGTVMKYKFISDGNWTPDIKAPDTIDDGFGGLNGLADIDAMVAAATPAAGAAPVAKKGSNLKFATWSMIGFQGKWGDGTADNKNELETAGVNLKSYLKVSGDALPGLPIYIEVALAENDSFKNLYEKGVTSWKDGFTKFGADVFFDPIYYFNSLGKGSTEDTANLTYLGHLKLGLDTPYVNYVTGYKYAKLPPHTNVNWITIDKEWEAGYSAIGGYSQFDFSPLLRTLLADTGVEANLVAAPNRSADRAGKQYGLYSYANAKFNVGDFSQYVDVQFNEALGSTWDTIFGNIYENDIIAGYQGVFGPVTFKGNYLVNFWGDGDSAYSDQGVLTKSKYTPASSDVASTLSSPDKKTDDMAANANVSFSNDVVFANVGYRMRGNQANMMYMEQGSDDHTDLTDQLGYRNHQRIFGDVNVNLLDKAVNIGVAPYFEMVLNKNYAWYSDEAKSGALTKYNSTDTMHLNVKPYFSVNLEPLADLTAKIDGYAKMDFVTGDADKYARGTDSNAFLFAQAGLKYDQTIDSDVCKEVTVVYAFDNKNTTYLFNTVTVDVALLQDITAQCGFGLRTKNAGVTADPASPFGFFVGGKKKLNVLYKPTAYIQYMYGMDPYNAFGDGPTAYKLDGYTFDGGVADYNGNAAVRCGLQWDL